MFRDRNKEASGWKRSFPAERELRISWMGKIYKTTNEWPTSNNIFTQWAEMDSQTREIFSLFWVGGWDYFCFMVFSSTITRSCAKMLILLSFFHSGYFLWLFSVGGACVMPHMLCTKAYTILQWLLKLGPKPKKKKVGKKQIVWERKVSNRQASYWRNQRIPTSQKRKTERIVQWDVRTSFVFVTLLQSMPSRDRVKYNIQFYTFPPVG